MDGYQMPGWAWAIFAVNTVIFVPIFLVVCYSSTMHAGPRPRVTRRSLACAG